MDKATELDLKYQFAMLALHVEEFLNEIANHNTHEGLRRVVNDDLMPMSKRLATIRSIQSGTETDCEDFARPEYWFKGSVRLVSGTWGCALRAGHWAGGTSDNSVCQYDDENDPAHDECIHCGQPHERK
jgi:hypothetical protein